MSIPLIFIEYFLNLFASSCCQASDNVSFKLEGHVSLEMNQALCQPFISEEIWIRLFQMHPNESILLWWNKHYFFRSTGL